MSDSTHSQNEYDHCSVLTTVAIKVYILSFILKCVALQMLVHEVLSLNIIRSPQDGDSGHENFDHYCTYFSTQKCKFYIKILPKSEQAGCKITDSLALNTNEINNDHVCHEQMHSINVQ